ncbi:MAG: bifunctional oligoribonuclease/PAP phosphatase NrnA [Lentisphaerae bacterium]|nr:bifunctional oligoribonuclease/PAP phosphatase NrnA [Lentisphaerota bacterium]
MNKKVTKKNNTIKQVLEAFEGKQAILLTGHVRPDGDALGSAIGLARLLSQFCPKVVVSAKTDKLGSPGFLRDYFPITDPETAAAGEYDMFVTLDCGTLDRIPAELQNLIGRLPVVNIDHHFTNTRFGNVNWIDPAASSTCEMVWKLSRRNGMPLNRETAEALWVGLITDTGRFAHDHTAPSTMRCAADLLKYGVRTAWINDRLYGFFSREVLELKRRAFNSLDIWRDGDVAVVKLKHRDFIDTGCVKGDIEDVVDIPRSLAGSRVALFFYEAKPSEKATRLSIRTRDDLDATELARQFGGGGHARAAGCTVPGNLNEAVTTVEKAVNRWLDQQ